MLLTHDADASEQLNNDTQPVNDGDATCSVTIVDTLLLPTLYNPLLKAFRQGLLANQLIAVVL